MAFIFQLEIVSADRGPAPAPRDASHPREQCEQCARPLTQCEITLGDMRANCVRSLDVSCWIEVTRPRRALRRHHEYAVAANGTVEVPFNLRVAVVAAWQHHPQRHWGRPAGRAERRTWNTGPILTL
jgi:hypothetical protein